MNGLTRQYSRWRSMHLKVGCNPPTKFPKNKKKMKSVTRKYIVILACVTAVAVIDSYLKNTMVFDW